MLNHSSFLKTTILASLFAVAYIPQSRAEDCTDGSTLPGTNCTMDENSSAALTIDNGVTLFTSGSISLDHTVDGSTTSGDGTISTADSGSDDTITQTADIGSDVAIDALVIDEDDTWVTSAGITTDNSGSDIDLGAGDGGEEIQFLSGSSFIGEISGHFADTVSFGTDGNGGTYEVLTDINGPSIVLTSGTVNIRSTVSPTDLSVSDDSALNLFSSVNASGVLDADGDIFIDAGSTLSADTYTVDADGANFTLGVQFLTDTTTTGAISITNGGPVDFSADTFYFEVDSTSQPLEATTVESVITGNGGSTISPTVADQSYLYDFSLIQDGDDYDLLIAVNNLESVSSNSNNLAVATVLFEDFALTEDGGINALQALLGNDSTRAEFNERLESLLPTMDAGFVTVSNTMVNQTQSAVTRRMIFDRDMNDLVETDKMNGEFLFSAGSKDMHTGSVEQYDGTAVEPYAGNIWAQAFQQFGSQDDETVDGFSMSGSGIMIGADMPNADRNILLGGAVLLGASNVDSDNANSTDTEVNSTGVSVYGARKLMDGTMLSGVLSYVHNHNEVRRYNIGGISGENSVATFKSEHLAVEAGLSRNYWLENNWRLNALMKLGYDHISSDLYDEDGDSAGTLSNVGYTSINRLSTSAHLSLGKLYKLKDGKRYVYPSAYVGYTFSPIHSKLKSTASLTDTNSEESVQFAVAGNNPVKHDFALGANVKFLQSEGLILDAAYALGYNENSNEHAVSANMKYSF